MYGYQALIDEWVKNLEYEDEVSYSNLPNDKRKDYCWDCRTDELYTHAMTFKCKKCNKIILGG